MTPALTVAQLKNYCGKNTSLADVYFSSACNAATERAQKHCNQILAASGNQNFYFIPPYDTDQILFPSNINPAVVSLQSRSRYSTLTSDYTTVVSSSYELRPLSYGNYVLYLPYFSCGSMYKLVYTGGYPLQTEIQTIILGNSGTTVTGGPFTLAWNGYTTAPIAWNAAAEDIEDALEILTSIGVGNISCAGSLPSGVAASFAGTLAPGIQPLMSIDTSLLTVGGSSLANNNALGQVVETQAGVAVPDDVRHGLSILGAMQIYNSNIDGGEKTLIMQNIARTEASGATSTTTVKSLEDLEMMWKMLLDPYRLPAN